MQNLKKKRNRYITKQKKKQKEDRWNNEIKIAKYKKQQWKALKTNKKGGIDHLNVMEECDGATNEDNIMTEIQKYIQDLNKDPFQLSSIQTASTDKLIIGKNEQSLMAPFQIEDLENALKKTKAGKATGPDNILNTFLIKGSSKFKHTLLLMFNLILEIQEPPENWGSEHITLFHKGGDSGNLDNYRGISITSNVGKLFCRMIETRLSGIVENQNLLGEIQNGFRPGRGTADNLFLLQNILDIQRKNKNNIFLAFIDFKKAYDRVWRNELWNSLRQCNLGEKFITLMSRM